MARRSRGLAVYLGEGPNGSSAHAFAALQRFLAALDSARQQWEKQHRKSLFGAGPGGGGGPPLAPKSTSRGEVSVGHVVATAFGPGVVEAVRAADQLVVVRLDPNGPGTGRRGSTAALAPNGPVGRAGAAGGGGGGGGVVSAPAAAARRRVSAYAQAMAKAAADDAAAAGQSEAASAVASRAAPEPPAQGAMAYLTVGAIATVGSAVFTPFGPGIVRGRAEPPRLAAANANDAAATAAAVLLSMDAASPEPPTGAPSAPGQPSDREPTPRYTIALAWGRAFVQPCDVRLRAAAVAPALRVAHRVVSAADLAAAKAAEQAAQAAELAALEAAELALAAADDAATTAAAVAAADDNDEFSNVSTDDNVVDDDEDDDDEDDDDDDDDDDDIDGGGDGGGDGGSGLEFDGDNITDDDESGSFVECEGNGDEDGGFASDSEVD
jgi:hypothetical protein